MSWSYYWGRGDGRIGDKSRDHALPVASSGEGRLPGSTVHHRCYCLQQKPERKVINNASRVICRTHHEPGLFPLRPYGCGCGWCASAYIRTYSYSGDMQIPEDSLSGARALKAAGLAQSGAPSPFETPQQRFLLACQGSPDADARSADVSGLPGRQITAHVMAAQVTEKPVNIPRLLHRKIRAILLLIVLGASALPGA
ncbi:hypothetical protein ASPFODRAFT_65461 [Aspergillus luchuensis CBS 106.47]|uniref:Uncharacterized protein n=1 Tax=Aspergillus luchuensis (strain CBS 106.47) TaxID=1137211 RepID=A0A1M3T2G0_ASPLC|nr:hypothetical protein ASPFODRAFT_65461 [Aspergillus luchuensis CBS 106.47]